MMVGDPEAWARRFVTIDHRLLGRIAAVWPSCVAALPTQPDEDTITINLVAILCKDRFVRRICHWIEFQFEPFGINADGIRFSKGKADMGVLLDWERERYLAYECKRLNVVNKGARSSLASVYVNRGMMRFMTEQYAEGLPVGCMLGYVMDNDVAFALDQLAKAIRKHQQPLALQAGPTMVASLEQMWRFFTKHKRSSNAVLELRHALLPFSLGGIKEGAPNYIPPTM